MKCRYLTAAFSLVTLQAVIGLRGDECYGGSFCLQLASSGMNHGYNVQDVFLPATQYVLVLNLNKTQQHLSKSCL